MTIESRMKPAADASFAPSDEYTRVLINDGAYVKPAAKNPTICHDISTLETSGGAVCLTATWYVCVESEPTTIKTPTITQNVYAITHHAKFGKPEFLTCATIDATKVISHASCRRNKLALPAADSRVQSMGVDVHKQWIMSQVRKGRRRCAL